VSNKTFANFGLTGASKTTRKTNKTVPESYDFSTVFSQGNGKAGQMTCFFSGCGGPRSQGEVYTPDERIACAIRGIQ
jgi:hypothetical protein